jgi:aminoglycoside 6'-N-acetyltransferase
LLTRLDFPMVALWLGEPHVAEWWDVPANIDAVEREFGASVDGRDRARIFVILADQRPVGIIQTYRLDDNPEYAAAIGIEHGAGVDLFVGDPAIVGGGFGSSVLRTFLRDVVWRCYSDVPVCVAGPSVNNLRSQRAFEKAGFTRVRTVDIPGEEYDEVIMVAPRP